jgi:hypothetical protein
MVKVTDAAIDLLKTIDKPSEAVLRLEPDPGAGTLALQLGGPRQGDDVIEHRGADVLHVSGAVAEQLDGAIIDVVETDSGPKLSLSRGASSNGH